MVREEADEARLGAGLVGLASRAGLPPTISNGVRMAFHRGHGRSVVPVRSAIVGGVFGVLGVTAGLVFAASLQSVLDAPPRYGWTWDVTTEDQLVNTPCGGDTRGLEQVPGLEAVAELCYGPGLQVDGRTVPSMAFRPLLGTVEAEVVEGRVPSGPDEIALGAETLDALGKEIGDTVSVAGPEATRDLEVVGQVVLPPIGFGQPLADGAVLTGEGNDPFFDLNNYYRYFVARYEPDADREAVDQVIEDNPDLAPPPGGHRPRRPRPPPPGQLGPGHPRRPARRPQPPGGRARAGELGASSSGRAGPAEDLRLQPSTGPGQRGLAGDGTGACRTRTRHPDRLGPGQRGLAVGGRGRGHRHQSPRCR